MAGLWVAAKANAKCGGLSTAAAKCGAFGRDDECYLRWQNAPTRSTSLRAEMTSVILRRQSNSPSVEMTSVTWLGGGTAAPFVVSDDAHLSEVWGSIGV